MNAEQGQKPSAAQIKMGKILETGSLSPLADPKERPEFDPTGLPKWRVEDAQLRGRDLGSIKDRNVRLLATSVLAVTAVGADNLDRIAWLAIDRRMGRATTDPKTPLRTAGETAAELVTDDLVGYGSDLLVRKVTGNPKAKYASELSLQISGWFNVFLPSRAKNIVNPVVVESAFRYIYQIPFLGAWVEKGYVAGNKFVKEAKFFKYVNTRLTKVLASFVRATRTRS